ncbi:MAG: hypothetical protein H3Z52_13780, partial [archaeon]|nr:hypothetical protein [archaeon]
GDGSIVAAGGAPEDFDSLYVFRIISVLPVGGELLPASVLNQMVLLALVVITPAIVIMFKLIKK